MATPRTWVTKRGKVAIELLDQYDVKRTIHIDPDDIEDIRRKLQYAESWAYDCKAQEIQSTQQPVVEPLASTLERIADDD